MGVGTAEHVDIEGGDEKKIRNGRGPKEVINFMPSFA
jgi:hypothetical protein